MDHIIPNYHLGEELYNRLNKALAEKLLYQSKPTSFFNLSYNMKQAYIETALTYSLFPI